MAPAHVLEDSDPAGEALGEPSWGFPSLEPWGADDP